MDVSEFKKLPIIGIMRLNDCKNFESLIRSVINSGLKTIEITMNSCNAAEMIKKAVELSNGKLTVGAGTVLNMKNLQIALKAGASFIVMPTLVTDIVEYCVKNKIPVFPGALTPQEIYNAWNAGATMVKVFPAKFFGPNYFKEIKGPFNNIELLACSGINDNTIHEYFNCGASAVAFGSSIFNKIDIDNQNFDIISQKISALINNYNY